jgi:hypothetical protein
MDEYRSEGRIGHRGAPFENTVGDHYKKQGYRVQRSYMSLGIWDLLCIKKLGYSIGFSRVVYVQVKGRESDPFTDEDKKALKEYAEVVGAEAHYAYGKRMPLAKPIGRRRLQKNRTVIIENLSRSTLGSPNIYEST